MKQNVFASQTVPSKPLIDTQLPKQMATATFAMGWFWGPDSQFGSLPGVLRTRVGYAGGTKPNPTYRDLGDHAETVQVDYDLSKITYPELLNAFWTGHDPTHRSWSRQYASIIFVHNEEERRLAEASKARVARGVKDPLKRCWKKRTALACLLRESKNCSGLCNDTRADRSAQCRIKRSISNIR